MPLTSANISGMVGGQLAMFANQNQFSQQIGGMVGTGPGMVGGGMQNPYPNEDIGARVAGGVGMALPGMATGASLAGMVMGGTAGYLDPFTGVSRGFARGVGMGGSGAGQVFGQVGRAFATGGLRAGAGMLGAGIGGAALAAGPYALAGMAISTAGENIYQGAQNIAEVGGMTQQYMGPQYGEPGARPGGLMGRGAIKGITAALHEIVSDDTRTSMEEIKRVMDQAGRMGMLTGITNAQEFKTKFQGIVRQVRDIADIMGASLEQAGPMMAQMRQMGLWSATDVMGTVVQARVAGTAAPQMMQTMQAGAQMAHALGGTMQAGARMGRQAFGMMQAARQTGVLSEEDIMEFTGGLGGTQGQQAIAQRMTGIMGRFGETGAGRLMMAGLGQTEEGEFTGGINRERLGQFLGGEIGVGQLQQMGQKAAGTQRGAMSYFRQAGRMGQELGAQGGMEAMTQIVQQIAETRFGGSEQARHQLFQQMLGVSNREAEMLGTIADEMPRIRDQQLRATESALNQAFQDMEQKNFRSWDAFKQSVGHLWGEAVRPLQEMGERMATDFGEVSDQIMDTIQGRVRHIPIGTRERVRLMQRSLTQDVTQMIPQNLGQAWVEGDWMANMNMRMRESGFITRGATEAGTTTGELASVTGMVGTGAILTGGAERVSPRARALKAIGVGQEGGPDGVQLGGGVTTTRTEMERGVRRAYMRAATPTKSALGIDNPQQLNDIRTALRTTIGKKSAYLRDLKEKDPRAYTVELMRLMSEEDGQAFRGLSEMEKLDYLAVAQQEEGYGKSELAVDFAGMSRNVGAFIGTPKELAERQNQLLDQMAEASGHRNIAIAALKGAGIGAGIGAALGGILAIPGAILGAGVEGITAALEDTGFTREDIERATTGAGSDVFMDFIRGGTTQQQAIESLTRVAGGDRIARLIEQIGASPEMRTRFKQLAPEFEAVRMQEASLESLERIRQVAARGPEEISGLRESTQRRFRDISRLMRGGGDQPSELSRAEWAQATEEARELAGTDLTGRELGALRRGGGALGRQVLAFREVEQLGGPLEGEGLREQLTRFRDLGYNLEQLGGTRLQEILRDKKVTIEEAKEFAVKAKEAVEGGLAETSATRRSANERLEHLLTSYTDANTKFVTAVGIALQDEISEAKEEIDRATRENKKTVAAA